ncbi:MAG TPA: bifunctional UDP-sugar hydrolase/5'-nucleotidase [Caulobacteraceae bacterium]|nr:bifunctional UDP-sugar hydrolase/5'-nucleotidase [Caulobacteraceae bacterium]
MRFWTWVARLAPGAFTVCTATAALAATQSLTILHDNDIHGHLRAFCYVEIAKGPGEHCDVGGAARRATLIRRLRAEAKAPTLLVDSGDTSTRGPLITAYEGLDEIAAMNAIGYNLAAVGNNEFKLKDAADSHDAAGAQAALAKLIRGSRFPWICANATEADGSMLPGVKPYLVRRIGKLRVAFIGFTTPRSQSYPQTRGLKFTDPVEAAKLWVPKARAEADVVIAVTHIGVFDDRRLAKQSQGIDAIVGGDSHTYLYEPLVEKNLDGVPVPIVQDGEFGVRLGVFDLTFEGDRTQGWKLAQYADRLVAVDAAVKPDPTVAALVERYARPLDVRVGRVRAVGATPAERSAMTAADLAAAFKLAAGTDIGLQPEGDLFESFRTPEVTRYQVRAIIPFHDTVWKGEISGQKLKDLLAKPSPLGGVMHATIAPADIDPAKTYTFATTDFVAQLGLGGGTDTGLDARTATEAWLEAGAPGATGKPS